LLEQLILLCKAGFYWRIYEAEVSVAIGRFGFQQMEHHWAT